VYVLTFKRPAFTYVNAHKAPKNSLFILGNKEIYCIFKTCCKISVLLCTKHYIFHNFIFFYSNNTHRFINCVLKVKYQPNHLKTNEIYTWFLFVSYFKESCINHSQQEARLDNTLGSEMIKNPLCWNVSGKGEWALIGSLISLAWKGFFLWYHQASLRPQNFCVIWKIWEISGSWVSCCVNNHLYV
jgi:hypothetical protein